MTNQTIFAFDLDGTVTDSEILPRIARELNIHDKISHLTRLTLTGAIDFEESFRLRFEMLKQIPAPRVQEIVADTPLNEHISGFIQEHREQCAIVTGNLDLWVKPLKERLGCRFFSSSSREAAGTLELDNVLRKDEAVRELKKLAGDNARVVAIGESVNDIPMFKAADISVAYAGVHRPAPVVLKMTQHLAHNGEDLCALLKSI